MSALTLLVAASLAFLPTLAQAGAVPGTGGKKSLNVYFSNVYIGASIDRVLLADPNNLPELLAATTLSFNEMVQSNPAKRMDAVAAEIAARNPDVVGLAELFRVEAGAPGQYTTVFDYLDLVIQGLAARGAHYEVAVVASEADIAMPIVLQGQIVMARIIDHEAILVRSDLPPGQLSYANPQTGRFQYRIVMPDIGLDLARGWCSIDMTVRGESFRFVCSHLETEAVPQLQYAQALELLAGPVNTPLPVVLVGDFNTDSLGRDGSYTYPLFGAAGFTDTWNVLNPQDPAGGLTWGHDPLLADPDAQTPDRRIDLILYRDLLCTPTSLEVVSPQIGTTAPLWFSDHAALSATLHLGNPKSLNRAAVGVK